MGLDMWIEKRQKEPVAEWRKANAVHRWFEKYSEEGYLENCEQMRVTKQMLEELLATCKKVKEDHSIAEKLLPTMDGFFFGDTKYSQSYFHDIDITIEQITKLLEETDFDKEELYYSAWW